MTLTEAQHILTETGFHPMEGGADENEQSWICRTTGNHIIINVHQSKGFVTKVDKQFYASRTNFILISMYRAARGMP
jgi:hypothetical protein